MKVKVACVQKKNVFLNSEATFQLLFDYLEEAISQNAKVIAFPETWLPGYPAWLDFAAGACLWKEPGPMALHRILFEQALEREDPRLEELQKRCLDACVYVVLGFHERVGKTIFNTIGTFGPCKNQDKPHYHRKLTPTYTERLVWGQGDGSELSAVKTRFGPLGALICWEHWIPPLRACFHAENEVIHVAQWPTVHDKHQLGSRHYAFEGQTFVIAVGSLLTVKDALDGLLSLGNPEPEAYNVLESMGKPDTFVLKGGSAVINPEADYILDPVFEREGIFYAELDLNQTIEGAMYLDTNGHYSRPDIFQIKVDRSAKANIVNNNQIKA